MNLWKIYESKLNAKEIYELKLNARIYDRGGKKGEVLFSHKRAFGESLALYLRTRADKTATIDCDFGEISGPACGFCRIRGRILGAFYNAVVGSRKNLWDRIGSLKSIQSTQMTKR